MAFPLLPILLLGGAAAVVAVVASRGSKYALSENCQENKLATMGPDELTTWMKDHLTPAFGKAFAGEGVIKMRPADGEAVPEFIINEVRECQTDLVEGGLTDAEAIALCRIDGLTVYFPAEPDDPEEIGMYLYQQVAHPNCATLVMKDWATPEKAIVWPSPAAECLYRALAIAIKMELLATTLDEKYAITPEDLAGVAAVCPQARAAWGGPGSRPGGAAQFAGLSVGAAHGLNVAQMAHDVNRGLIHPAHVLSGQIFR